ncbi:MAG TPA: DNA translocase FtsK 4TM domain-containing protein, partial [Candidatus Andersenbacteria bacterium]|nr:DNA translocase FtsK 4TM domain-containing protein [Candidatus Andersenbacteria bacterium]
MRLNPFASSRKKSSSWLRPETKRAVIGILLILFSCIAILSFFSAAGPSGSIILSGMRDLFGILGYLVPFILIAIGVLLIRPREDLFPRTRIVGIILLAIGLLGTFHIVGIPVEDAYQAALEGRGGGIIGFLLVFPLSKAFSSIASGIIFTGALIVGIFLTFNISPKDVKDWMMGFLPKGGSDEDAQDDTGETEDAAPAALPLFRVSRRIASAPSTDPNQLKLEEEQRKQEQEQKERMQAQRKAANKAYVAPSLDILHSSISKPDSGDVEANKKLIQSTLEKFGIAVTMGKVSVGPTVAQYTLRPEEGVKLARITALQNDLALALAAHPIRIEAP